METMKKRATLAALLLLLQMSCLIFSFDAIITKDANIKQVLLPVMILQIAAFGVLLLVLAVQGAVLARRGRTGQAPNDPMSDERAKWKHATLLPELALMLLWVVSIFLFRSKGVLQGTEIGFFAALFAIAVLLGVVQYFLDGSTWKAGVSGIALTQLIFVILVSFQYKNEMFSPSRIVGMYLLTLAFLLLAIWGDRRLNLLLAAAALLVQAVVTLTEFYKLNRSTEVLGAISELLKSKTLEQVLTMVIVVLVVALIVSLALQFFREFHIVGKLTAVVFSCVIVFASNIVGSLEHDASKVVVDAKETVNTIEYYVYVDKDADADGLEDILDYRIGLHYEHSEEEVKEVVAKLNKAAGKELSYYETDSVSALMGLYDLGDIDAFVLDAGTIDDMDAELEMRGEDRVISEEMKIIYTLQLEYTPEEDEAPDVNPNSNIDANTALSLQPFVVYVSGIDVYGSITTKSRSDVNVLVAVNPQTKEIAMVTTPRDAYVDIPGKTTTLRDKLTHAGNYGVSYSIATLEQLYGVNVDFFIRVNFTSMEAIVDLLDGIDVYSHYDFTSRFHNYHFNKGYNHMNGSQALAFARERKTVTGGDVTRGKHHLELIKGIFAKATTTSFLMNYQSLLAEVKDNFQTNMTMNQIAELVSMQLNDNAEWHFTSYATSGNYVYDYCASYKASKLCVSVLKEESVYEAAELMVRVLNGEKIPEGSVDFE